MALAVPLDQMTAAEKLQLMEDLWADLAEQPDDVPSPAWHREVLQQREQRVVQGEACFYSVAEAKRILHDRLK
ncbi:MAG: addiction module protein [Desulfuromonas sp.]|jgi:hypothetical protein|uniref:addiction module protein n=1 Tax=Desulfuromonas thiophila TaxID=57664 RepID=UPI0024A8F3A9|nr:addiction module protein [Desulfuromonas thiophila]MCK9173166.1 addiction module protein [Desulfuromonas thiophila]MDD3802251.1 addiction module protein [Desulfuromonas thiophila]